MEVSGQWHGQAILPPANEAHCPCVEGRVGFRARLNILKKRENFLPLPWFQNRILPAGGLVATPNSPSRLICDGTERQCEKLFSKHFGFPLSVFFHHCTIRNLSSTNTVISLKSIVLKINFDISIRPCIKQYFLIAIDALTAQLFCFYWYAFLKWLLWKMFKINENTKQLNNLAEICTV